MNTERRLVQPALALLLLILLCPQKNAAAAHCEQSVSLAHAFTSGAAWELCWRIDPGLGLVLSELAYTDAQSQRRKLMQEMHVAGLLIHYDDATDAVDILSTYGLGGAQELSGDSCAGEVLTDSGGRPTLCRQHYDHNTLTRYEGLLTLRRNALRLQTHAQTGAQLWTTSIELSEDGSITPATTLSGRISHYTSRSDFGTAIEEDTDQQSRRLATSATLLSVWRMDFNIDDTADNDIVDEVEFVSDNSTALRRYIALQSIERESRREIRPERFRGWHIRDRDRSASSDGSNITRVGYYLDPQSAGYRYSSNRLNWARYQFFVTENSPCERLVVNNQTHYPDCGDTLDDFINHSAAATDVLRDPVAWYALTRRFVPHSGDWPLISSRRSAFRLVPFDWSASSPFSGTPVPAQ